MVLLEQARLDGGLSYGDDDGNVEKLAKLWYNSKIESVVFVNGLGGLRKVQERKDIKTTS